MMEQTSLSGYVKNALERLQAVTDHDVQLAQGSVKLRRKHESVILHVAFELEISKPCSSAGEWLGTLVDYVMQEGGYGDVNVVVDGNGEVVGGRVEVSYDLKSF